MNVVYLDAEGKDITGFLKSKCICQKPNPYEPFKLNNMVICAPIMPIGWCQDCYRPVRENENNNSM